VFQIYDNYIVVSSEGVPKKNSMEKGEKKASKSVQEDNSRRLSFMKGSAEMDRIK